MASSVIAVEWLNQNASRNYPFREDCSLRPNDSAGALIADGWRLPNCLVTDFVASVHGSEYDPTIYLKRLSVISGTVTLVFADADDADVFTVSAGEDDGVKQLAGVGSLSDASGVIRFGDIGKFLEQTPDGLYVFSPEESLIEPTCLRPSAQGVRSIGMVDSAGYATAGLRGAIKLIAGDNINIRYDREENALTISADPNSGYTDGCDCATEEQHVVRSINGISTENVIIEGNECFNVETIVEDGIIRLSDKCSKPCCGCAETAFINQTINDLQSSVNTLTTNATVLSDRVTSFVNNYLLARKTLA